MAGQRLSLHGDRRHDDRGVGLVVAREDFLPQRGQARLEPLVGLDLVLGAKFRSPGIAHAAYSAPSPVTPWALEDSEDSRQREQGGNGCAPLSAADTLYMIDHMKQLLIEIEDDVAAKLEQVAPGRSRRRSSFIRDAIRRALWEIEEATTAEAYRRQPDSAADAHFDPKVWEVRDAPAPAPARRRRGSRR